MRATPRLLLLLSLWSAAAAVTVLAGLSLWGWGACGALLLALLLADLLWAALLPAPAMDRRCQKVLALGVTSAVELRIAHSGARSRRLLVHDHHPPAFRADGLPLPARLPARGETRLRYLLTPTERGDHRFGPVAAWMSSPLGLWQRRVRGARAESVRVYPNFRALARYTLMATGNRVARLGIHPHPRRGAGLEFHQLRDYRHGDSANQINWKATSRRLKLISAEYQDEQDQRVVLLLDCGRRMRSRDGELSHFDHALNAVLLLAHIALRQGDSVGLSTFGGTERHLAARKGIGTVNALLKATYDIQPSVFASDLAQALEDCARRVRRRSLIVLVSNLSDQQPENLAHVLALVRRRHLVLFASLREEALDRALDTEVEDLDTALRLAAAHDFLQRRSGQLQRLRAEGALCLDSLPRELAPALANAYLEIKAGRLL